MKIGKLLVAAGLAAAILGLGACTSPAGPVIAPITRDVGSLQGETVELVVGQALNIDTGDLDVTSYEGEVADPAIAEFVAGRESYGAVYNPGVKALAEGTTTVVLSDSDAATEDVTFTVEVRP
ncbi:hypothetical protein [Microbacterium sp. CFBP9034]|uniref:hypothetical protein n=1 Tax=Microbacterium sp. CFBP9034 TaxID=3096540 RepID=UPI002A69BA13|nr:hypothetical protein [Microbacterium sp. CFBP9034]MDY0909946.1 hypothetical protein [Microbacterium sp. CFBP9034]